MKGQIHGGLFIERDRVLFAVSEQIEKHRFPQETEALFHHLGSNQLEIKGPECALATITRCARIVARYMKDAPGNVGVGCYGPFVSLDPGSVEYGVLAGTPDHPLGRVSLPNVIKRAFEDEGLSEPLVAVQTDVNVGAVGEAYVKRALAREITVYLMLTEGIGGGFARGNEVGGGILHSEVGMAPVTPHEDDVLLDTGSNSTARGIGGFANTQSMFERARRLGLIASGESDLQKLFNLNSPRLWPVWQGYIAQLCLIFTSVLTPTRIVLGGPLMEREGQIEGVRMAYRKLWEERASGPRVEYEEQGDPSFLSLTRRLIDPDDIAELEGAVYLASKIRERSDGANVKEFRSS